MLNMPLLLIVMIAAHLAQAAQAATDRFECTLKFKGANGYPSFQTGPEIREVERQPLDDSGRTTAMLMGRGQVGNTVGAGYILSYEHRLRADGTAEQSEILMGTDWMMVDGKAQSACFKAPSHFHEVPVLGGVPIFDESELKPVSFELTGAGRGVISCRYLPAR